VIKREPFTYIIRFGSPKSYPPRDDKSSGAVVARSSLNSTNRGICAVSASYIGVYFRRAVGPLDDIPLNVHCRYILYIRRVRASSALVNKQRAFIANTRSTTRQLTFQRAICPETVTEFRSETVVYINRRKRTEVDYSSRSLITTFLLPQSAVRVRACLLYDDTISAAAGEGG